MLLRDGRRGPGARRRTGRYIREAAAVAEAHRGPPGFICPRAASSGGGPARSSWRWLSPWQVGGRVHGTDRGVSDIEEVSAPDAWLCAPKWPGDDCWVSYDENEASAVSTVGAAARAAGLPSLVNSSSQKTRDADRALLREAKSPEVDLAMLAASLVEVPRIKAPRAAARTGTKTRARRYGRPCGRTALD